MKALENLLGNERAFSFFKMDIYQNLIDLGSDLEIKHALKKAWQFKLCEHIDELSSTLGAFISFSIENAGGLETLDCQIDLNYFAYKDAGKQTEYNLYILGVCDIEFKINISGKGLGTHFSVNKHELKGRIFKFLDSEKMGLSTFEKELKPTAHAVLNEILDFKELAKERKLKK